MKRETLFLKIVVFLMGITILGLCVFGVPSLAKVYEEWVPNLAYLKYPFVIGVYTAALAFFFALYQTLKLLAYIDKGIVFSELPVQFLKNIKYCASIISSLQVLNIFLFMPVLHSMKEVEDAPTIIMIGLIVIFASIVIAVFAAVLQKLLQNAMDIKAENDLTV
ncbi:DUF2975 domain-containing protein [Priestia taiwanensis]|uniref:Membrane protein YoaS n=1 Tax=Priestia taiwanensis TaxID=1347902 RepID=A0A917AL14_9BACI|nr:DUF2975 domain-containing protein [Priestia taiwanensis]MBM7362167.1 nitrate/nitrite transporter NarK [Priestia taiwanensis]GGE59917.1 putative membrane protein YoaS [Priestia taiwanensis]